MNHFQSILKKKVFFWGNNYQKIFWTPQISNCSNYFEISEFFNNEQIIDLLSLQLDQRSFVCGFLKINYITSQHFNECFQGFHWKCLAKKFSCGL